jgi:flagellar biosynthesis chaperone FliJ
LKDKINDLKSNRKNKNNRDLNRSTTEFKKGYQPRTNLVKNEDHYQPRTNLVKNEDPNILSSWKNYFCQQLNVQRAGGVRQTEVHTAEPFVPQPSASEAEVAIES